MTTETKQMAQVALETYDEKGEAALIEYLSHFAADESDDAAWNNSGVCLLKDGSAVVQDLEKGEFSHTRPDRTLATVANDTYTFRSAGAGGNLVRTTRDARLPRDQRRFSHYHRGPVYPWPSGETLMQNILTLLASGAQEAATQDAEAAGARDVGIVNEWEARNISDHRLFQLIPELARAVDGEASSDIDRAGVDYEVIDHHMENLAEDVMYKLGSQDGERAERTLALAALLFEDNSQAAEALAQHWGIIIPT